MQPAPGRRPSNRGPREEPRGTIARLGSGAVGTATALGQRPEPSVGCRICPDRGPVCPGGLTLARRARGMRAGCTQRASPANPTIPASEKRRRTWRAWPWPRQRMTSSGSPARLTMTFVLPATGATLSRPFGIATARIWPPSTLRRRADIGACGRAIGRREATVVVGMSIDLARAARLATAVGQFASGDGCPDRDLRRAGFAARKFHACCRIGGPIPWRQ